MFPLTLDEPKRPAVEVPVYDRSVEDLVRQTRAYLATIPGAASGRGGHGATFRAACKVAVRLRRVMTWEQALPVLAEWNATCEPPWGEADLAHKLKEAWEKATY